MIDRILENVIDKRPFVHCLINYVVASDVANIILAVGGAPIMSDEIEEIKELVNISDCLIIDIGTLDDYMLKSIILAGKEANKKDIPVILDIQGIWVTKYRIDFVEKLLKEVRVSVIEGNAAEIKYLYDRDRVYHMGRPTNIDIVNLDNLDDYINKSRVLAKEYNCIITVTGEIDIISDKKESHIIGNGHYLMGRVVGIGCMLSAIIGTFLSCNMDNQLESVILAVAVMGICGEKAKKKMDRLGQGLGSYKTYIFDYMSNLNSELIEEIIIYRNINTNSKEFNR